MQGPEELEEEKHWVRAVFKLKALQVVHSWCPRGNRHRTRLKFSTRLKFGNSRQIEHIPRDSNTKTVPLIAPSL